VLKVIMTPVMTAEFVLNNFDQYDSEQVY